MKRKNIKKPIILFSLLVLLLSCQTSSKKEDLSEVKNPNFTGTVLILKGAMQIGKRFDLIYNSTTIKGFIQVAGPRSATVGSYQTTIFFNDKKLSGKFDLPLVINTYKLSLIYNNQPISGEVKKNVFLTGNFDFNLIYNSKILVGTIKQPLRIAEYDFNFAGKNITGKKIRINDDIYYDLKFGDEILKGKIKKSKGQMIYQLETGNLSDDDLMFFIIFECIRIMEDDFEKGV